MSIPAAMRALVKARPEVGLWMQEVPVPEIALDKPSGKDRPVMAG